MILTIIRGYILTYPIRVLAFLLGLYCLVCLVSCSAPGARAPAANVEDGRVAQAVADARSGIDAAKIQLGPAMDPRAGQMLDGASEYALAAAGKTAIPAPAMSPAAIVSDPDAYHKSAVDTRQHADGSWLWVKIAGGFAAAIPIAAMLLKNFGGPIGNIAANIALPLANTAWHTFAPQVAKDADEKAHDVTAQAKNLIDVVDSLDPALITSLPEPVRAAIGGVRAAHAG